MFKSVLSACKIGPRKRSWSVAYFPVALGAEAGEEGVFVIGDLRTTASRAACLALNLIGNRVINLHVRWCIDFGTIVHFGRTKADLLPEWSFLGSSRSLDGLCFGSRLLLGLSGSLHSNECITAALSDTSSLSLGIKCESNARALLGFGVEKHDIAPVNGCLVLHNLTCAARGLWHVSRAHVHVGDHHALLLGQNLQDSSRLSLVLASDDDDGVAGTDFSHRTSGAREMIFW